MRSLLIGILAVVLISAPVSAQQLAQVTVSAHLTIPQVLTLRSGAVTEGVTANGKRTRQATLFVTANRSWVVAISRTCSSTCGRLPLRIVNGAHVATVEVPVGTTPIMPGRSGTAIPIMIEMSWDANQSPPNPSEVQFLITAI